MLSTKVLGSVEQAAHYFLGHDNYYTDEQTLAQERSQWWGKGAAALGLSGSIDPERFTELLKGHLPNGERVGKMVDDEWQHRPGFDLTFSVPKSVSLLALLGNDERIIKAVENATDKVLNLIEREHAKTRVTQQGVVHTQRTGQLVIARFLHDLSREGDPQLHTHCVVMNLTQRADGQWRSLASQMGDYSEKTGKTPEGFIEAVRHHKKYYGAIFRAELAYELNHLGYSIQKTGEQGFFEVAGFSPESLKAFSQRRQEIEALLKSQGLSGAKAAAVATLETRRAKQEFNRQDLQALWHAKAELHSVPVFEEAQKAVAQALNPALEKMKLTEQSLNPTTSILIREALQQSIAHLSETKVAIRESELVHRTLHYLIGEIPVKAVLEAVDTAKKQGDLIALPVAPDYRGEAHWTTPALLVTEQALLKTVVLSHISGEGVAKPGMLSAFLNQHTDLTPPQQQAIRTLFTHENAILALTGATGSGKTHLIAPMMTLAQVSGYQPILLTTQQAEAVHLQQLIQKTPASLREWVQCLWDNKQFDTVFRFLREQEKLSAIDRFFQKKPMIFVDNAMQLSIHQSHQLAQVIQRTQGRLVLIGDPQSTLTWLAGTPFTQMLANGIVTAHLPSCARQADSPLKSAVEKTVQGQIAAAFDKINHRIFSIENGTSRCEAMAAHFAELSPTERRQTQVFAPNQSSIQALNGQIREALKNKGELLQSEMTVPVLLPHFMRIAEQKIARHYQVGQWIRFHRDYLSLGVQKGGYRQITGIDVKHNQILLSNEAGRIQRWNPHKVSDGVIEVFQAKNLAVAVGESVVWQRADKKRGLYRGERLTVAAISEKQISFMRESGKSIVNWNLCDPSSRHFNYGYAVKLSGISSKLPEQIIAYLPSGSSQSHQRAFYHLLTHAKESVWIYTENKNQLLATIQRQSGNKIAAVDALLYPESSAKPFTGSSCHYAADHVRLLEKAVERAVQAAQQESTPTPERQAQEAVKYALAHLSEKEAAFTHKEVLAVALAQALGTVDLGQLQAAVIAAEKNGDLIRGLYSQDGTHWTTQEALRLEREIVALARTDQGSLPALASADRIEAYLQQSPCSAEHARVLRELFTQPDRLMLLQGFAGTGKTTLLQHVETLKTMQDYLVTQQKNLLCLAPTHTAVKEIHARGLMGETLDRFLLEYSAGKITKADYQHKILVVDESSMISNRRCHDFLVAVKQLESRALLVGDIHQYTAIEAGKPFVVLQKAGVFTVHLTEITRQKNEELKAVVKAVYQKDFAQVFERLDSRIIEIGKQEVNGQFLDNRVERLEKIRDDYLSRDPVRRAQTLIVTFGNEDRILQNALIREGLKQQGELTGDSLITDIFRPRTLSEVERSQAMNYRIGDILRFNVGDSALGIQKGDYWTVKTIIPEHQTLQLEKQDQTTLLWKPRAWTGENRAGVEVYQLEARELLAGDLIRWTRSDKKLGLISPELAVVDKVEGKQAWVQSLQLKDQGLVREGKVITLMAGDPRFQHWDHAYAMTGYSSQGKTFSEVIVNAESHRPQLTSQPSLTVVLTRPVHELTLYTDDKKALLRAIINNSGEKSSALEMMGEMPNHFSNQYKINPSIFATKPPLAASKDLPFRLDVQRISEALVNQAETVVARLLGEPKIKTGSQNRYGTNQGSLIVTMVGDKRGLWHDFQTGQGGHLLGLIALQKGWDVQRDFPQVLEEAVRLLGSSPADISLQQSEPKTATQPFKTASVADKKLTSQQQGSLCYARQLAKESQPVAGTLAERYLSQHRGISLPELPESIRFHPNVYSRRNEASYPALLIVAKDSTHKVQAVQAIFLNPETAAKADVLVKKQTWGLPSQGLVALGKANANAEITYLAEGAETGLSVYMALKNQADVRVTLGKSNFKNGDPATLGKNVVLCLDNDGQNPQSDKLIRLVAEKLAEQGKQVWVAQPHREGQDYNDVLVQQGQAAVKVAMEKAVSYEEYCGLSMPKSIELNGQAKSIDLVTQAIQFEQLVKENQIQIMGRSRQAMIISQSDQPFSKLDSLTKNPISSADKLANPPRVVVKKELEKEWEI